jgi:hypothetical protein
VVVLADGFIGQMMEPVQFAGRATLPPPPPEWALRGTAATRHNLVTSIYLEPDNLERHSRHLEQKYQRAEKLESRAECWRTAGVPPALPGDVIAHWLARIADRRRPSPLPEN